jgi:hypothetical protein
MQHRIQWNATRTILKQNYLETHLLFELLFEQVLMLCLVQS